MPHVPPAPPVGIDVRIADGTTLDWDPPARIVAAPGHTPGSVAVLFEDAGVLVAGDAIASFEDAPIVGVFNADVPQAVATFRRLAALDVDIVLRAWRTARRRRRRSTAAGRRRLVS